MNEKTLLWCVVGMVDASVARDIKFPSGAAISVKTGDTLVDMLSQIQPFISDAIVAVRDDTEIIVYTNTSQFPVGSKHKSTENEIYKFRTLDGSIVTIFGREAAAVFFPPFREKITVISTETTLNKSMPRVEDNGKIVTIMEPVGVAPSIEETEFSF